MLLEKIVFFTYLIYNFTYISYKKCTLVKSIAKIYHILYFYQKYIFTISHFNSLIQPFSVSVNVMSCSTIVWRILEVHQLMMSGRWNTIFILVIILFFSGCNNFYWTQQFFFYLISDLNSFLLILLLLFNPVTIV